MFPVLVYKLLHLTLPRRGCHASRILKHAYKQHSFHHFTIKFLKPVKFERKFYFRSLTVFIDMSQSSHSSLSKASLNSYEFSSSRSECSSFSPSSESSAVVWSDCTNFIRVPRTHFLLKTVSPILSYCINSISSADNRGGEGFLSAISVQASRRSRGLVLFGSSEIFGIHSAVRSATAN